MILNVSENVFQPVVAFQGRHCSRIEISEFLSFPNEVIHAWQDGAMINEAIMITGMEKISTRCLLEQLDHIETKSCSQILTGGILRLEMRQQFRNRVLKYISFQGMHFFLCKLVFFG